MEIDSSQKRKSDQLRILVVDDDEAFLQAMKLWLESYDDDGEISTATNGTEALEIIDSTLDVLICDRQMPELTGDEVIRQLGQKGYEIATIVISAYKPDSSLHQDDADLYLQKPIDREDLLEALDQILLD